MSDTASTNLSSHTLAYLRKLDAQIVRLTDLVIPQQDLLSRMDRSTQEGFDHVRRDVQTVQRDVRELKSDMVLMENRVVSALSTDLEVGARLSEIEEQLGLQPGKVGL